MSGDNECLETVSIAARILQESLRTLLLTGLESITQAYIQFRKWEEGNLEQYDTAVTEQSQQEIKKKGNKINEAAPGERTGKKKRKNVDTITDNGDDFQVKNKRKKNDSIYTKDASEPLAKKMKEEDTPVDVPADKTKESSNIVPHGETIKHDSSKDNITVFVSNLDFSVEEGKIKEVFETCGEITNIRLVRNFKGKSKGFGYVEFTDSNAVLKALKLDRTFIDGRPVFVSRCEDRTVTKQPPPFKFSTHLEKNKLFIKGLPFTITNEELEEIFQMHGKIKEIRMVTYRNGSPKGIAYVEYNDEQSASQAVLKTDGMVIGEHTISVAISNPPERKTPLLTKTDIGFEKSLGGGKKETAFRGKARTQVTLLPRALRPNASKEAHTEQSQKSETLSKSNADFRAMLLKK
ncbi:Squamous cell carcinoma antigen recognized by T-cells 3 [Bulinus truncatus]|nr:Squamous cell carcinoma antigen recognized by T-cells 3 [Bulinus truncatus]